MKIQQAGLFLANLARPFHSFFISERRKKVIVEHLLQLLPSHISLHGLDVGCGNGKLASYLCKGNANIEIDGVDVLTFEDRLLKNTIQFDGGTLPFKDKSYDFIMIIDVLHHADDPAALLEECARVARKFVLIKDHLCESRWDDMRLRWMDWVGNRAYHVSLPFNFFPEQEWTKLFKKIGTISDMRIKGIHLYPWPLSFVFEDRLHFIAKVLVFPKEKNTSVESELNDSQYADR